jgi:hypothetical protein
MGVINLDDIEPGMTLAEDVRDYSGRILLAAGTEITDKHLRIFKMWGITEADIQGLGREDVASSTVSQLDPALIQQAEEQGRLLFRHTDLNDPFTRELFRLFILRTVRAESGADDYVS